MNVAVLNDLSTAWDRLKIGLNELAEIYRPFKVFTCPYKDLKSSSMPTLPVESYVLINSMAQKALKVLNLAFSTPIWQYRRKVGSQ